MPLVCRICSRVNPADALYCYHDGVALGGHGGRGGPVAMGAYQFHNPFVFPSGRSCRSFDELVLACESNWAEAQDVLRQGYFEGFLGGLGRADLARSAREAARAADRERALDEFLSALPATTRKPPQLEVRPVDLNLGLLSRDQDQRITLDLANLGMGLLSGSISTDCDWLSLGDGAGSPRKLLQFRTETSIGVRVIGKCLRAGAKKLEGRLNIETNGGGATVVIRAEVPIKPFPSGVLAGSKTPRELASKAKHNIKEAAPAFERGEVEEWYKNNGWTYPVQGPNFSGIHAIQQFFEALGLVTPPKVEINTRSIYLAGAVGSTLNEEIKVKAEEKKPVFAYGVSSAGWLTRGQDHPRRADARIPISVPMVPAMPGERLQARVDVTANGNQRFVVEVTLNIAGTPTGRSRLPEPVRGHAAAEAIPVLPGALVEVNYADVAGERAPPRQPPRREMSACASPGRALCALGGRPVRQLGPGGDAGAAVRRNRAGTGPGGGPVAAALAGGQARRACPGRTGRAGNPLGRQALLDSSAATGVPDPRLVGHVWPGFDRPVERQLRRGVRDGWRAARSPSMHRAEVSR